MRVVREFAVLRVGVPGWHDALGHRFPLDATEWLVVGLIAFVPALTAETVRWRGGGRSVWVA